MLWPWAREEVPMPWKVRGRVAVEVPEDLGRPDHGPAVAAEDYLRLLAESMG